MEQIIGNWKKVEMVDIENLLKEWQVNWIARKFATLINPRIMVTTEDGRLFTMVLQVPICFGYAPEEKFNFTIDQAAIRQIFFYEECDISAHFDKLEGLPDGTSQSQTLKIDIDNEKLANPKVTVTKPSKDGLRVQILLSRGNANFHCCFTKEVEK